MSGNNKKDLVAPPPVLPTQEAELHAIGAYNPELSKQAWDKSQLALKETPQGRAVIRTFSRGLLGTTAFALGNWWSTRRMTTYAPTKALSSLNEVEWIARGFDNLFGAPLKATVNFFGGNGEKFVNNFRPTAQYAGYASRGRSLGHEVVMVTFDFASMSIGDFWGRKIVHTLDPNRERPAWKREDGSTDWVKALETFGKNWWTAVTYSAGEDWAVAVPYCLTMRHVGTPLIDKIVPGYRYEFDRNGNGGGMLVNEHGKLTGNFTTAGVLNLWERFTTYNVGTLMYREAYHWTGSRLKHAWKKHEMPALVEKNPNRPDRGLVGAAVDGSLQFVNWVARSTVKAVIYMIPAVPFFWITRTPQHKFQGRFIHPDHGVVMYQNAGATPAELRANTPQNLLNDNTKFFFNDAPHLTLSNPITKGFNPNSKSWGWFDTLLNPIAKANDWVREKVNTFFAKGYNTFDPKEGLNMANTYINAAIAYTPYFWAKSDWLADKWDYGRMDAALDRTIAGAVKLKPSEFSAGLGEVGKALTNKPFADPVREQYAQCRIDSDTTPSDNKFDVNPTEGGNCDQILKNANHPSFTSRVQKKDIMPQAVQKAEPKLGFRERVVHGGKKTETVQPRGVSHVEAEEMRKFLEDFNPPTNSIN